MMMTIKVNRIKLFVAIEKGVGKYKNSAFLLMKLIIRIIAREQIKENMNTTFKFEVIKERKSSVKLGDFNGSSKYQTEL